MNKILIVYYSGSGCTKAMAEAMASILDENAIVKEVSSVDMNDVKAADKIMMGCPAMGAEVLEEAEFQPFYDNAISELSNKKIALFGSYGWGDGEWMRAWQESVKENGANLFEEGLIINGSPDDNGIAQCKEFALRFLNY